MTIWFRWAVTDNLRGDEGAIHAFFSFMIEQGPKNVENESLLGDNVASVPIIVAAFSNYSLERWAFVRVALAGHGSRDDCCHGCVCVSRSVRIFFAMCVCVLLSRCEVCFGSCRGARCVRHR